MECSFEIGQTEHNLEQLNPFHHTWNANFIIETTTSYSAHSGTTSLHCSSGSILLIKFLFQVKWKGLYFIGSIGKTTAL